MNGQAVGAQMEQVAELSGFKCLNQAHTHRDVDSSVAVHAQWKGLTDDGKNDSTVQAVVAAFGNLRRVIDARLVAEFGRHEDLNATLHRAEEEAVHQAKRHVLAAYRAPGLRPETPEAA